ncbi:FAD:protein FMN transferase [Lentilitoribacter sp. Alg239-R112]|uniref:FAD:protein FMN transferase n=1 Tax=Lentilitoribacter sp. Alg239-R112 TaxID=2305987 RepID=UPI0013A6ED55|nr:FAD:protein FMN transferase [Lentilitoribacter sp. Alg239-R112]
MSINRRRFITIAAGATFATSTYSAHVKPVNWKGIVLGADSQLIISDMAEHDAKQVIKLVVDEVNRLEDIFSLYRSNSALMRLNRFGLLENPPLELVSLFSTIDLIHDASGGYFDPTIQPLWQIYAEHKGHPPRNLLEQKLKLVGWDNVEHSTQVIQFAMPAMALTLNGIAQGFVTDRIVQVLKSEGLRNAVVKMGEISALGQNERGKPWNVSLSNADRDIADKIVPLSDTSIATSSVNGTTFDGYIGHILDPKHGIPGQNLWQSISVINKSASLADGISTAASLMNESQIEDMLVRFQNTLLLAKFNSGEEFKHQS